jgi:hypothetical protein
VIQSHITAELSLSQKHEETIKKEVRKLEELGVLEWQPTSEWADLNNMRENEKCIDYDYKVGNTTSWVTTCFFCPSDFLATSQRLRGLPSCWLLWWSMTAAIDTIG